MAALLGLERAAVEKTCLDASKNGIVAPANYNSPGRIIIAGERKAVEAAMKPALLPQPNDEEKFHGEIA